MSMPAVTLWCWDMRPESSFVGVRFGPTIFYARHRRLSAEHNLGLLIPFEVRRVGRQVDQVAASRFDQLPDLLALMDREVVHHDHLADPQARSESPIDVGLEENLRG